MGINNAGQIVGNIFTGDATNGTVGFLLQGSSYATFNYSSQTNFTLAYSINNNGQIVGQANTSPSSFADFLYTTSAGFTLIPSPQGDQATEQNMGINDSGQVTVSYLMGTSFLNFIYDSVANTFTPFPDNPQGPTGKTNPIGINNSGQVVGCFLGAGANCFGFIATPQSVCQAAFLGGEVNSLASNASCPPPPECKVADLSSLSPDAVSFESSAPSPPGASLFFPEVQQTLDGTITKLLNVVNAPILFNNTLKRTSGYRSLGYQAHLYQLRTRMIDYLNTIGADPTQVDACADLKKTLDFEIKVKHGLATDSLGIPKVNNPSASAHTSVPAMAMDLNTKSLTASDLSVVDLFASFAGLVRPCHTDVVHYTLPKTPCAQTITAEAQSPVNILITDALGRRVGFDPSSGIAVNELGAGAYYSGPGTDPQIVDINNTVPGAYSLVANATGSGPYTLSLSRIDEDAGVISQQVKAGTITTGETVVLMEDIPFSIQIDIQPGEFPNTVNSSSRGNIPVALLSSASFDAPRMIVPNSLRFGPTGGEQSLAFCVGAEDVNEDGLPDLVCHFDSQLAGFKSTDTQGIITGKLQDGKTIDGADWVRVKK
jgi:hypothetical protein